jgi:hypothetical protein
MTVDYFPVVYEAVEGHCHHQLQDVFEEGDSKIAAGLDYCPQD